MAKHKASPEKKRKRVSDQHGRPTKKPAIQPVAAPLNVQFIQNPDGQVPVIASTPGLNLPESVPLNAYVKPRHSKRSKKSDNATVSSSEMLLHLSAHPKFDFTGREGENELDEVWNHYVAIYDPEANGLQLVEARRMTVRGCVRQASPVVEEETDEESVAPTAFNQRSALAEAFGTKQSRKAVQAITENALLSNVPSGATNAAESALLSSMPADKTSVSGAASAQDEIQAAKPLPQPNLTATQPSDVYSVESLVPNGVATLRSIPTRDWQEAAATAEGVLTTSRFVSNRVNAVVESGNKSRLQLLRLILVLIELSRSLKRSNRSAGQGMDSRKLPPREELRSILSNVAGGGEDTESASSAVITDPFLDALRRKFVPQGSFMSKNDITFLHTTICALSLHIPPASGAAFGPNEIATDPADLRDDLRLDNQTMLKYFRELGCKVDKPRETEFAKWGIKRGKPEAAGMRVARLKVPVEFPKLSRGRMR